MLSLKLKRIEFNEEYTRGILTYQNGTKICDTLEDKDRGLDDSMSFEEIGFKKIPGKTAIPTGTYKIQLDIVSPKYSNIEKYKKLCQGKMPRLMNVKGFTGILIHSLNTAEESSGCIGVGIYDESHKGYLKDSFNTFIKVYNILCADSSNNITLTIIN